MPLLHDGTLSITTAHRSNTSPDKGVLSPRHSVTNASGRMESVLIVLRADR
jgi:hypothetical protein